MTQIYHNPRCRKSRETLQLLEEKGEDFEIVLYLDTPPSQKELSHIITLLGMEPIDLVRKNEALWKAQFKNKKMTPAKVIAAMVENPKLIERPIIIKDGKAALGRPPERVLEIL